MNDSPNELEENEKTVINLLEEGEYFGEISCCTGMMNTASVQVIANVQNLIIASMPARVFKELEENAPSIYLNFRN